MRLTKYGQSCLLVEDGDARVLLDPGSLSQGFEDLRGLTAVLITHSHADHLDIDRLIPLLDANDGAELLADADSAGQLRERGVQATAVDDGDASRVGGLDVRVIGSRHAVIHPEISTIANVGYLLGGRLFHPGDSFAVPAVTDLELLALPLAAPWAKVSETVEHLRAVAPRRAFPIHDAILAVPQPYIATVTRLAPSGTQVQVLEPGEPVQV